MTDSTPFWFKSYGRMLRSNPEIYKHVVWLTDTDAPSNPTLGEVFWSEISEDYKIINLLPSYEGEFVASTKSISEAMSFKDVLKNMQKDIDEENNRYTPPIYPYDDPDYVEEQIAINEEMEELRYQGNYTAPMQDDLPVTETGHWLVDKGWSQEEFTDAVASQVKAMVEFYIK